MSNIAETESKNIRARKKGDIKTKDSASQGKASGPKGKPIIEKAARAAAVDQIYQSIKTRRAEDGKAHGDEQRTAAPVEKVERAASVTSAQAVAAIQRAKRTTAAKRLWTEKQTRAAEQAAVSQEAAPITAPMTTPAATNSAAPSDVIQKAQRMASAKKLWNEKQARAAEQTAASREAAPTPSPAGISTAAEPTPAPGSAPASLAGGAAPANVTGQPGQAAASLPAIRERGTSGTSPAIKEKPRLGPTAIKTRPEPRRTVFSSRISPTAQSAGRQAAITSAKKRQRRAQEAGRQLLVQQTKKAARTAAVASRKIVEASAKATKALISALVALLGGSVFIAVVCLIFLVAAIVSSPFGILFTDEPEAPDAVSLSTAMSQINEEYNAQLEALQTGYDTVNIQGRPPSWRNVIAVFAARTAAADDGMDVITLDAERVERLRAVFWDMTTISTSTESIDHPDTDPDDGIDDSHTESVVTITINGATTSDMTVRYGFTRYQVEAMEALMDELEEWGLFIGDLEISDATAIEVWNNLPAGLSNERRTVIQYALSLVGKVHYFWGGKSLVLGWDPRWGTSTQVWAAGSPTTGTYRPYGMDCSGFVDWCFYNQSGGEYIIGHGGGCIAQHNTCRAISWGEAIPGDLVFYPGDSHIGIVCGWDANGNILIVHCASGSLNGVVITGKSGFVTIGRPTYYGE